MSLTPEQIQAAFEAHGLGAYWTLPQIEALSLFTQKMLSINETLNLTRWTSDEDVLTFHLLDSAMVLPTLKPLVDAVTTPQWVDLGTGCGFPGSVVMTAFPKAQVTLMDSVAKKLNALEECLQAAHLRGSTAVGRAEDMGRDARAREQYDGVTVRAVADFPVVLEYALPLLKVGGYLVDWMTEDQVNRLKAGEKALQTLGGEVIHTVDYLLPGSDQERFYTVVKKIAPTPAGYPRPVGQPSKHPL